MERGDNGKFRKSASPAASTSGEDVSRIGGIGENAYEEPVESLATPVAVMSVPALPSDTGTTGAEDAPIKNDDSAEGRPRGAGEGGAGEGGDGTNDEVETIVSMLAAFKCLEQQSRENESKKAAPLSKKTRVRVRCVVIRGPTHITQTDVWVSHGATLGLFKRRGGLIGNWC
jgi:hypothetical protein